MKVKFILIALISVLTLESCSSGMSSNQRVDKRKKQLAKKRKKHPTDCPKLDCD